MFGPLTLLALVGRVSSGRAEAGPGLLQGVGLPQPFTLVGPVDMNRRAANAALLTVSVLVCLGGLEAALRVFPASGFGLADPAFFRDNWFEYDPELGYVLRRNHTHTYRFQDDDGGERSVQVTTGTLGVRDTLSAAPPVTPLVVFIGDSFTEAYHVDAPQSYPRLIGEALRPGVRTANLGVHNYNCANYYRMAVFAKRRLSPRTVFVGLFVGNDVLPYQRGEYRWEYSGADFNTPAWTRGVGARSYLLAWVRIALAAGRREAVEGRQTGSGLDPRQVSVEGFFDDFAGVSCPRDTIESFIRAYASYRQQPMAGALYGNPWESLLRAKATAMVLGDLQAAMGDTRLHVLIFPERLQVSDAEWGWLHTHLPRYYQHRILVLDQLGRALAARNVAFTNTLPLLDRGSYLRFDAHFSAEGHRRIAALVVALLGGGR